MPKKEQEGLEPQEIEEQEAAQLPDREAMSVIDLGEGGGLAPPELGPNEPHDPNQ